MPTMTENDGKPDNEELIIVEEKPASQDNNDGDDQRPSNNEDDDGETRGDANDPEREAIRERRRLEKLERKKRRDEAIGRDKLELSFLRNRNDDLERRLTAQEQRAVQQDLSSVDASIQQAMNEARMAEQVIAKAVAAGNGEDVTQAMRYRDQAFAKANHLASVKQQREQSARVAPVQNDTSIDPAVIEHAKDFMEDAPWYKPDGSDEESAIVLAIDAALMREGFDPKTEDYWDELRKRSARRLPERFGKAQASNRAPRGGPAVGSGREHAPQSTRTEVYISPERKQALIDAGVWDDPVLRQKYVKRYAAYDKANRA
jgi:hypothetical protein